MITWQYRDSPGAVTDLVPLFRQGLQACRLKREESVMVFGDHHTPRHYAAAFVAAAQEIGADVFQLVIPNYRPDILDGPIWETWHLTDMIVDLESISTSIYRPLRVSALEAGARILRVTEPEDVLFRLPPHPSVRERVKTSESLLEAASTLHVTSPAGTELHVNVDARRAFGLWGAADAQGTWAHWSVGVVVGGANRPQTNGRLVIDVGDLLLAMRRYVTTPIEVTVEEGIITDIAGGLDAYHLQRWFKQWDDPRAYYISHIGWGCDPRADWNRMAHKAPGGVGDVESVSGVFQIAFGRDTSWYIGGGTNDVPAHMDFNCLNSSITLNERPITQRGRFVHSELP